MIPVIKVSIGEEEKKAVREVLDSGMLAQGPKVKELEEKFSKYCGTKYAVATTSGTSALHAALYGMGIKKGDEVITVPFTFVATANCIIMQGAKPVFVDIKEDTFNLDPEKLKKAITPKTKAIIVVDLFGQPYDVEAINKIAEEHKLLVLEDACQAVGAEYKGKKAGNFSKAAAFSFYATKNLMTGEGGIITTDDEKVAELAKRFRHHGQSEQTRYEYHDLGYNYRMTDMQAALGLVQLGKIEKFNDRRREIAKKYDKAFAKLDFLEIPFVKKDVKHVYHQYTLKVKPELRDRFISYLKEKDIGCAIFYPKPLHMHPFFTKMGYKEGDFPVSEKMAKMVVSIPCHPSLSDKDVEEVIKVVRDFK